MEESQVAAAGLTPPLARMTHIIDLTQGGVQGGDNGEITGGSCRAPLH